MSDVVSKAELKRIVESLFIRMDDVGAAVHPWVVEDFIALAKLADVPTDLVPTELRVSRKAP